MSVHVGLFWPLPPPPPPPSLKVGGPIFFRITLSNLTWKHITKNISLQIVELNWYAGFDCWTKSVS